MGEGITAGGNKIRIPSFEINGNTIIRVCKNRGNWMNELINNREEIEIKRGVRGTHRPQMLYTILKMEILNIVESTQRKTNFYFGKI